MSASLFPAAMTDVELRLTSAATCLLKIGYSYLVTPGIYTVVTAGSKKDRLCKNSMKWAM